MGRRRWPVVVITSLATTGVLLVACSDGATTTTTTDAGRPSASSAPGDAGPTGDASSPRDAARALDIDASPPAAGITFTFLDQTRSLTADAGARGDAVNGIDGYAIEATADGDAEAARVTLRVVNMESGGGATPVTGVYPCPSSPPAEGPYLWASVEYEGSEGLYSFSKAATCVTVASFGAVGEPVYGYFQARLDRVAGSGPVLQWVSGTFNVPRLD